MNILGIYHKILLHFGKQYWWPVTKSSDSIPKYHEHISLTEQQKLEICFGAILTQNTNWKNAEKAIIELNKNRLIDVGKIKKINKNSLAKIIKSSGYHNQKAIKLKNFCQHINHKSINEFFNKRIYPLRNELLSIYGIGPETADSILLYAAKKPIFIIDAYARRIMSRIGYKENTYEDLQNLFMKNLEHNESLFKEYHALLVELGKNICKKKPLCLKCPINNSCNYYKTIYLNKNKSSLP
jgi:endonuclease III related protein